MSNETSGLDGTFGAGMDISPEAVQSRLLAKQSQEGAERLSGQVSHDGQDPPYITRIEHFEGISHEEIFVKARGMTPAAMQSFGDTYVKISNALSGGLLGAHLALNRALSDGLEGEFATGAAEAAKRFYDQATDVQEVIHSVGRRLKAAGYGAEVVKNSVPEPPTGTASTDLPPHLAVLGDAALTVASPSDTSALERAKEEQRQIAIGVMNTVYKPTYQPAGEGVPTFVPVQVPGDNPTGPVPGSTTSSGPGSNQPGPGNNTPGAPENGRPEGEQPGSEEPQTTAANTNQNPAGQNPQQTSTPTTPGTPTGDPQRNTTTTAGVPGVPSTPGRPSTPGAPGSNPQAPGPGRSIPGAPTAPGVPGAATPAAAATAAGRPMTGMPGMMSPGAARRGGDDETERKTPDYLVTNREEELFGRQSGTVPEAIGADAPANRPAEGGDYR